MYYLTPVQSGVNSHSIKDWYLDLSEFADAVTAIHLHPPQPTPRWSLPYLQGVSCAPAFISGGTCRFG